MVEPAAVLRPVPGFMALGVMGEGLKLLPRRGKPITTRKMVRGFTNIMVGTSLIGPTAGIINTL